MTRDYGSTNLRAISRKLKIDMRIKDPKAHLEMLVADFSDALTNAAILEYLTNKSRAAIRLLTKALYPPTFWANIEQDLERSDRWKKNFLPLIAHVGLVAKQLDVAEDSRRAFKRKNGQQPEQPGNEPEDNPPTKKEKEDVTFLSLSAMCGIW